MAGASRRSILVTGPDREPIAAVIGAGVVGGRVVRHIISGTNAGSVFVADARPAAADAVVDACGGRAVAVPRERALHAPVVVIATPAPQLALASSALERGAHVVTTSDEVEDVTSLLRLASSGGELRTSLVVGANLSPGIAGLVARMLVAQLDDADEIHVAMHGTGGPSCARQHHRALAGIGVGWHDGEWIERPAGSGRELCYFPEPVGPRDCYRAEIPDPIVLHQAFPSIARITARMSATRRDRLTARLPMLSPPHREGAMGALRVEVRGTRDRGREALVVGLAERTGTATAVMAGIIALSLRDGTIARPGLILPGDPELPNDLLLDRLRDGGVVLTEFVGSVVTGSTW